MIISSKLFTREDLTTCLNQSQEYGFLSPQSIENQIQHSTDFISLLPTGIDQVLDLGAGGGLPSLVWLHLNQEIKIVALDSMRKRINFLTQISTEYESLNNRLTPLNGRAEELAQLEKYRETFEVVVARGFGQPSITAECGSGFLKIGGYLYVSGRPVDESQRWDKDLLAELGLVLQDVLEKGGAHVAKLKKINSLKLEYPRSSKVIKKRPLW